MQLKALFSIKKKKVGEQDENKEFGGLFFNLAPFSFTN